MPRRSGGGRSSPSRGFSSVPSRPVQRAPAPAPAPQPPAVAQPRQPGLMAQMATTAAGVAVGSAVGHTIGHAMTGGGGGGGQVEAPVQQQPVDYQYQQQQQPVCQYELKQFLDCAQSQHDITLCSAFNDALRQCKMSNGIPLQ